jgi:hypothetical protein
MTVSTPQENAMNTDREFLDHFTAAEIPCGGWNHEAQVRTAYLSLKEEPFPEAVRRMRSGIQRFFARYGGEADPEAGGYHETLTLAWARLVAAAMARVDYAADFASFISVNPELLLEDRIQEHYSQERLSSPRAQREFMLPDRAPLPAPEVGPRPWAAL